jgi:hypothetical protein
MSPEISERSFEDAIEYALLQRGGPSPFNNPKPLLAARARDGG